MFMDNGAIHEGNGSNNEIIDTMELTIERRIGCGDRYDIHPSMVYAGIDKGTVEVIAIIESLDEDSINVLDVLTDEEKEIAITDIQVYDGVYGEEPYVFLRYTDHTESIRDSSAQCMPMEVFLDHTTLP